MAAPRRAPPPGLFKKAGSQAVVCGNGILVRSPLRAFPGRARAGRHRVARVAAPARRRRESIIQNRHNTGETHP
ncbi:hypothetical protein BCEP27_60167 [Burkholderia cepacia]